MAVRLWISAAPNWGYGAPQRMLNRMVRLNLHSVARLATTTTTTTTITPRAREEAGAAAAIPFEPMLYHLRPVPEEFQQALACNVANAFAAAARTEPGATAQDTQMRICGRVTSVRAMGKHLYFSDLEDHSGRIQVMCSKRHLDEVSQQRLLHRHDHIEVFGSPGKTKTGEPTLKAQLVRVIAPCQAQLPDHIEDKEKQVRERHIYLNTVDNDLRQTLKMRNQVLSTIREFFALRDFVEVETPILSAQSGGAIARPFITRANALQADLHLRIAPELYLKRLVIGGLHRVFEIGKVFRNEVNKVYADPGNAGPVLRRACQELHLERMELFINGAELCNAYQELNDPAEQRRRFEAQHRERQQGNDELPLPDEDFCQALEAGLPPTVGWGLGVDRVIMVLSGKPHIRDVLAFPILAPKQATSQDGC
ncbi:uncharacterized protein MONBRDRAFT_34359 [Monosiga brevicollis MX1]|uniref:Lysyl-tRNA synthetase n=1 Tax=Monosiga brevicollis TaxID=81824 RepID=A9VB54_MONBE|nr:uncharacterized protein MONBRDRAFT_34359 [Monosiga brevicollis MX1]EDQ85280.1 predicted protein [Monosiga brevicollis MX1]|eukprot:XP_001749901.1 hypothetical protein [Monosiga brevicollis MX1]